MRQRWISQGPLLLEPWNINMGRPDIKARARLRRWRSRRRVAAAHRGNSAGAAGMRRSPKHHASNPSPRAGLADSATMKGRTDANGVVIRVHVAANGNVGCSPLLLRQARRRDMSQPSDANPPILEFNSAGRLLRASALGSSPPAVHPRQGRVSGPPYQRPRETILSMPARNALEVPLNRKS